MYEDIPRACVVLDQRDETSDESTVKDSEELTEIAATIVKTMTSVASNDTVVPTHSSSFARRPTTQDWENVSVSGVPQTHHSSQRIRAWSQSIQALTPADATSDIIGAMLRVTTFEDGHTDLDSQLLQRRFELAQSLFAEAKFSEALPHLEKTLANFTAHTETRQEVQLLLAMTLLEIKPISAKAETVLAEIASNSTDRRRAQALRLLTTAQMDLYPDDLARAKESGTSAYGASREVFGLYHAQTMEAIRMMVHLCSVTGDSDALVWQRMLAEMLPARMNHEAQSPQSQRFMSPYVRPKSTPGLSQPSSSNEVDLLRKHLEESRQTLKEKEQQLSGAAMQLKALQETASLKDRLLKLTESAAQELENKQRRLHGQHDQLKSEMSSTKASMAALEQQYGDLSTKYEALESRCDEQKEDYAKLQRDQSDLTRAHSGKQRKVERSKREVQRLESLLASDPQTMRRQINQFNQEADQLRRELEKLKQMNDALDQEKYDAIRTGEEHRQEFERAREILSRTIANSESDMRKALQDRERMAIEYQNTITALEISHRHEIQALQEQLKSLEAKAAADLRDNIARIGKLTQENTALEQSNYELHGKLQDSELRADNSTKMISDLNAELQSAVDNLASKDKRFDRFEKAVMSQCQRREAQLQARITDLEKEWTAAESALET